VPFASGYFCQVGFFRSQVVGPVSAPNSHLSHSDACRTRALQDGTATPTTCALIVQLAGTQQKLHIQLTFGTPHINLCNKFTMPVQRCLQINHEQSS
jgi:hypothetical protein